jgi:hypothetical protein
LILLLCKTHISILEEQKAVSKPFQSHLNSISIYFKIAGVMANIDSPFAFGNRLLAQTLNDLAVLQPERIYASIPKSVNLSDGFLDVSFRDMERMVSALERWIEHTWRKSSSFETIAYFGISDLRSVVVFFAAVNSGYRVS